MNIKQFCNKLEKTNSFLQMVGTNRRYFIHDDWNNKNFFKTNELVKHIKAEYINAEEILKTDIIINSDKIIIRHKCNLANEIMNFSEVFYINNTLWTSES